MNSTNIKVMSEEIQHLKDEVHNLDVEIPSHDSGDAGKYLGVDSSGDLEFSDPLPAKTEAATGDVLGLTGEGKIPGWITPYTPKDYSETEQDTGLKWNGKNVYQKTFVGTTPSTGDTVTLLAGIDDILDTNGCIVGDDYGSKYQFGVYRDSSFVCSAVSAANDLVLIIYGNKYKDKNYVVTIRYTKVTTTKATKKKTTKSK